MKSKLMDPVLDPSEGHVKSSATTSIPENGPPKLPGLFLGGRVGLGPVKQHYPTDPPNESQGNRQTKTARAPPNVTPLKKGTADLGQRIELQRAQVPLFMSPNKCRFRVPFLGLLFEARLCGKLHGKPTVASLSSAYSALGLWVCILWRKPSMKGSFLWFPLKLTPLKRLPSSTFHTPRGSRLPGFETPRLATSGAFHRWVGSIDLGFDSHSFQPSFFAKTGRFPLGFVRFCWKEGSLERMELKAPGASAAGPRLLGQRGLPEALQQHGAHGQCEPCRKRSQQKTRGKRLLSDRARWRVR